LSAAVHTACPPSARGALLLTLIMMMILLLACMPFGTPRAQDARDTGAAKSKAASRAASEKDAKKAAGKPGSGAASSRTAGASSAAARNFASRPARKDVRGRGPSMLNKKKTLAAAAARKAGGTAGASPGAGASASSAAAAAAAAGAGGAAVSGGVAAKPEGRASNGERLGLRDTDDPLDLRSSVAYVMEADNGKVVFQKNADVALPIASISKLMTAMVVIDAGQDMHEVLEISDDDIDTEKGTRSRLRIGSRLSRGELLHLALMSSENRAASALGRHYPGGLQSFVSAMNAKARLLGMAATRFTEPTGLSSRNVSTARDLALMVQTAGEYPLIRQYSTSQGLLVGSGRSTLAYRNTNRLTDNPKWEIELQKTGFISEAGNCLVMQLRIEGRQMVMVLLDARQKLARFGDAQRLRSWIEAHS